MQGLCQTTLRSVKFPHHSIPELHEQKDPFEIKLGLWKFVAGNVLVHKIVESGMVLVLQWLAKCKLSSKHVDSNR